MTEEYIVLNNKIYKIILTAIHVELQDYFTEEKLFLHRDKTKDQNIHTSKTKALGMII